MLQIHSRKCTKNEELYFSNIGFCLEVTFKHRKGLKDVGLVLNILNIFIDDVLLKFYYVFLQCKWLGLEITKYDDKLA